MIKYFTGKPRSGKTYLAVYEIYHQFINPVNSSFFGFVKTPISSKYRYLYTNINGFNHDNVNKNFDEKNINQKSFELKWDLFYHHISSLYKLDNSGLSDEDLVSYVKKHNLYKSLIVIDEAHKYFDKLDKILVWFLGYHGHLGFDIILITQNLKKVHDKYKADSEIFIDAQSKSKTFFDNQLRYYYYQSDYYSPAQRYDRKSIFTSEKIYSLYVSGDIHKPKKIYIKYIVLLLILFSFTIYYTSSFFLNFGSNNDNILNNNTALVTYDNNDSNTTLVSYPKKSYTTSNLNLVVICDNFECWNSDDNYKSISYSTSYLLNVLKKNNIDVVYTEKENQIVSASGYTLYNVQKFYIKINNNAAHYYFPDFFRPYISNKPISIASSVNL